jgi:hypothetical protein
VPRRSRAAPHARGCCGAQRRAEAERCREAQAHEHVRACVASETLFPRRASPPQAAQQRAPTPAPARAAPPSAPPRRPTAAPRRRALPGARARGGGSRSVARSFAQRPTPGTHRTSARRGALPARAARGARAAPSLRAALRARRAAVRQAPAVAELAGERARLYQVRFQLLRQVAMHVAYEGHEGRHGVAVAVVCARAAGGGAGARRSASRQAALAPSVGLLATGSKRLRVGARERGAAQRTVVHARAAAPRAARRGVLARRAAGRRMRRSARDALARLARRGRARRLARRHRRRLRRGGRRAATPRVARGLRPLARQRAQANLGALCRHMARARCRRPRHGAATLPGSSRGVCAAWSGRYARVELAWRRKERPEKQTKKVLVYRPASTPTARARRSVRRRAAAPPRRLASSRPRLRARGRAPARPWPPAAAPASAFWRTWASPPTTAATATPRAPPA